MTRHSCTRPSFSVKHSFIFSRTPMCPTNLFGVNHRINSKERRPRVFASRNTSIIQKRGVSSSSFFFICFLSRFINAPIINITFISSRCSTCTFLAFTSANGDKHCLHRVLNAAENSCRSEELVVRALREEF